MSEADVTIQKLHGEIQELRAKLRSAEAALMAVGTMIPEPPYGPSCRSEADRLATASMALDGGSHEQVVNFRCSLEMSLLMQFLRGCQHQREEDKKGRDDTVGIEPKDAPATPP